ncbi:MAG: hypothetical protein QOI12_3258 [Alphaproteobacteria bacterium]|jgi:hypothetical protein|nr:hypothetical protein [Alphaproteobacteria bacterium]
MGETTIRFGSVLAARRIGENRLVMVSHAALEPGRCPTKVHTTEILSLTTVKIAADRFATELPCGAGRMTE